MRTVRQASEIEDGIREARESARRLLVIVAPEWCEIAADLLQWIRRWEAGSTDAAETLTLVVEPPSPDELSGISTVLGFEGIGVPMIHVMPVGSDPSDVIRILGWGSDSMRELEEALGG